ncbi:chemoreceptor glutamine deamidase CheD [Novispirillum sp. DQ9]|uniref:chemoreceptor glutamine deamidase CheD n=1 Tax=Novispirillum sp. DQ9 TaxID=3398612 RepID=UPI003C7BB46B
MTAMAPDHDPEDGRRRYFDAALGMTVVQVLQGDYYVTTRRDEVLSTVLGSCVAACVRDPLAGCGGMNHFLLPDGGGETTAKARLRYGAYAMDQLIQDIIARGGRRDRLEVKVFGGGNVIAGLGAVGHRNADFVESYLANLGLAVAASHLRGTLPRRVVYTPRSGRVRMRELAADVGREIFDRERRRQPVIVASGPASGAIELFD